MVDTHAHLGMCEPGTEALVAAAREAGVRRVLAVGIDEESNRDAVVTAEAHEEVFACVGRHPNSAAGFDVAAASAVEELAAHGCVRAIGETGLDYYREGAPRDAQRAAFEAQIGIARRAGLPLVIVGDVTPYLSDCIESAAVDLLNRRSIRKSVCAGAPET